jgi:hypothetical protein
MTSTERPSTVCNGTAKPWPFHSALRESSEMRSGLASAVISRTSNRRRRIGRTIVAGFEAEREGV